MMPDVLWCTSLPSRGDRAAQARRVASWGGHVVSFNDAEEAAALGDCGVERVTVSRSGRRVLGKPVPFLADIFDYQYGTDAPVLGIVNADIAFDLTEAQRRWLVEEAAHGLVCIRRTDVPDEATPLDAGTQLPQGFDAFLYGRDLLPNLRAEGFCLGMPFWDFWLPVVATLAGHPVFMVTAPVARHVEHAVAWDSSAPVFMHVFLQAVLSAASSSAEPLPAALLSHQLAAYRALVDLAGREEAVAQVLAQVYDDFQSRVLGAVAVLAKQVETMPV
ncbi:hypothetical protein [Oleispirillum naphthae]|uniref:hypothetical protein n=1 Tax=Oleispirillum naphthae TaxID=2838853 RepID=UPI0030824325